MNEGSRWPYLDTVVQDLRLALRLLRKAPGFTAVAIVTLALGIGANTAIFSVVESVLLRPLPFRSAERLVDVTEYNPSNIDTAGVPYPDYLVWKEQNTVFDETAAYFLIRAANDIVLGGPSSVERLRYSTVTNSFFSILGVQPALGRGFSADDETPGTAKAFLVSDAVWHSVFGGERAAIGQSYLLDGERYTLRGIMPPGFDFPKGCGVWVPVGTLGAGGLRDRVSHPFHVLGRLEPGVTLAQAGAQIDSIQQGLGRTYAATDAGWHVRVQPLLDAVVGNVRTPLYVLLGAAGFILLIACTNVVNLMLVRASVRERELAIRTALGAGRPRLVRQGVTESLVIVAASLLLAVALAKWGLALIVAATSITLPRMGAFELRLPVLAFMAAIGALATLVAGVVPALQRGQPRALREGRSGGAGSERLRRTLVVSEVALALMLLCGAGLMLRSFVHLTRVDPGFRREHILTFKTALPGAAYPRAEQTTAFVDRLLERLRAMPGVTDAAATTTLPVSGESDWSRFQIGERPTPDWTHALTADVRGVSAGYFHALGIPLVRGRDFSVADAGGKHTLIINEAMARRFWPQGEPLGQQITYAYDTAHPRRIVGVVADVKTYGLGVPSTPEMYEPYDAAWYMGFVLRTSQDPASAVSAAREQVAAIDRGVPVYQVATMDQLLDRSVAPERFDLLLLSLFAALALALAAVGLYGVLAYAVSRRTHEIGLRVAVGARQRHIIQLVGRQGMRLVFTGIVIGLVASYLLTRVMASLLFGVSATDPATFASVSVLLVIVAGAACYVPVRRAMRVDPMAALRSE